MGYTMNHAEYIVRRGDTNEANGYTKATINLFVFVITKLEQLSVFPRALKKVITIENNSYFIFMKIQIIHREPC